MFKLAYYSSEPVTIIRAVFLGPPSSLPREFEIETVLVEDRGTEGKNNTAAATEALTCWNLENRGIEGNTKPQQRQKRKVDGIICTWDF